MARRRKTKGPPILDWETLYRYLDARWRFIREHGKAAQMLLSDVEAYRVAMGNQERKRA